MRRLCVNHFPSAKKLSFGCKNRLIHTNYYWTKQNICREKYSQTNNNNVQHMQIRFRDASTRTNFNWAHATPSKSIHCIFHLNVFHFCVASCAHAIIFINCCWWQTQKCRTNVVPVGKCFRYVDDVQVIAKQKKEDDLILNQPSTCTYLTITETDLFSATIYSHRTRRYIFERFVKNFCWISQSRRSKAYFQSV